MLNKSLFTFCLIGLYLASGLVAAQTITGSAIAVDADYITMYPGEESEITIKVENNMDDPIEDVSVELILDTIPFTAVGSSEKEIDEVEDDDSESVRMRLRASSDATPGDYNIPYKVTYTSDDGNVSVKEGSFGLRVSAQTNLDYSIETKNPVIGQQGKITLNIVNKGLGKIKFISVEVYPQGYELLSAKKIYIGTINSDDDDVASFDVIFRSEDPRFAAKIEYKDFENNDEIETVTLPVTVYTQEKALELGLIQKSNTTLYLGIAAGVILIWVIWGRIKKRRKKNKEGR